MCYLLYNYIFQYPNGNTWPLIISSNHTIESNERNKPQTFVDTSWQNAEEKTSNLIAGNQVEKNSTLKGGTYNPRQAWQTIDRGRIDLPRLNTNDRIYQQRYGNLWDENL